MIPTHLHALILSRVGMPAVSRPPGKAPRVLLLPLLMLLAIGLPGHAGEIQQVQQQGAKTDPDPSVRSLLPPSPGIVLLYNENGGHGTGFVLDSRKRLVVTAAHVADQLYTTEGGIKACLSNGQRYSIKRVWYHPALVRRFDHRLYRRSMEATDGMPAYHSPDVAVLELAGDGALPDPFQLVSEREVAAPGDRVVIEGFPGALRPDWPRGPEPHASTAETRVLESVTDAGHRADVPWNRLSTIYLQESGSEVGGQSGAPIVLENGRVLGDVAMTAYGIHANRIRELCWFHGLRFEGSEEGKPVDFPPKEWLQEEKLGPIRQAVALVREAGALRQEDQLQPAIEKCSAALKIVPEYPAALAERALAYLRFADGASMDRDRPSAMIYYLEQAAADADECTAEFPEWVCPHLLRAEARVRLARQLRLPSEFKRTLADLRGFLVGREGESSRMIDWEQAKALAHCAECHAALGNKTEAKRFFDEAVHVCPWEGEWCRLRGEFELSIGNTAQGTRDFERAYCLDNCDFEEPHAYFAPG